MTKIWILCTHKCKYEERGLLKSLTSTGLHGVTLRDIVLFKEGKKLLVLLHATEFNLRNYQLLT